MSDNILGPTGEFPEGKDYSDDEGEIRIGVSHDRDNVRIAFGKEIAWIAFPPAMARELAGALIKHAEECER